MDLDTVKGNWQQLRGLVKEKWGAFTDNDVKRCEGRNDRLIGRMRSLYRFSEREAQIALVRLERQFRGPVNGAKTRPQPPD